jgi:hypothetical protein
VAPTAPVVTDACGNTITPVVTTPSPIACNGHDGVYVHVYGLRRSYTRPGPTTYTIAAPDFTLPVNGASTVNCPSDAVAPNGTSCNRCLWKYNHHRSYEHHHRSHVMARWCIRSRIRIAQVIHTPGPTRIRSPLLTLHYQLMEQAP